MLLSYLREDNPDVFLHNPQELLQISHIKSKHVRVRIDTYDELQVAKHWAKLHRNTVSCITKSNQMLSLCSLFLKTTGTLCEAFRQEVHEEPIEESVIEPVIQEPIAIQPIEDAPHEQMIALILHCTKYSHRKDKYISKYRPILESLGFSCVYVLGYDDTVGDLRLVEDTLYVPVKEGYERCNLKMFYAYEWCKQFRPKMVLKIDDDITIVNERVFRTLVFQTADYVTVDVTTCGDGISTSHIKKSTDIKRPVRIKKSTYGVGGMHLLSGKALNSITYEDMTQTIYEDVNMGIAKETHRWTHTNLNWIRKKVVCYEIQK